MEILQFIGIQKMILYLDEKEHSFHNLNVLNKKRVYYRVTAPFTSKPLLAEAL